MATEFHGTIYNVGDVIPGYVTNVVTPKVYYDSSKKYVNEHEIFDELSIDPKVWMGDEVDDMSPNDEIVNDIMKYLNLHIIQIGYDFYIFDWNTIKDGGYIQWYEIYDNQTKTDTNTLINVDVDQYKSADTNISMAEVYNQLKATCTIDKFDDVIKSPFEDSDLYSNYLRPQLYMREHVVEGTARYPANEFARIILNKDYVPQGDQWASSITDSYFVEWWMQVMQNDKWHFKLNGNDCYENNVYHDGNGVYYNQWQLLQYINNTPFASGIIKWGHGDKRNWKNWTQIENISSFDTYLVIGVHGNGENDKHNYVNGSFVNGTPHPSVSDLQNCGMSIEYTDTTEINYSPTDDETTNYLVFSGKFVLQPFIQKTGSYGEYKDPSKTVRVFENGHYYDIYANYDNYLKLRDDNNNFQDCYNTLYNLSPVGAMDLNDSGWDQKGYDYLFHNKKWVGSKKNDEGRYYQQLYYDTQYSGVNVTPREARTKLLLSPPVDYGDIFKLYKYELGKESFYQNDVIGLVPVFECELMIGDKYCVETFDEKGESIYQWLTSDELPTYIDDVSGQVIKKQTFSLGFNPKDGDYIIGTEHEFKNTVNTSMGLESVSGTAIPIKKSDAVSGEIRFRIVGLINTYWNNAKGARRHPTWFRKEILTNNDVPILSHVRSVLIKGFDVKFKSDNGGYTVQEDKDLIYCSAETDMYVNIKDDIEFKINTALTSEEAYRAKTTTTINRNNVIYYPTGERILNFTNNITDEVAKAEQHYIDAYWREYNTPRVIIETDLNHDTDVYEFNKYHFNYFNNKNFYPIKIDYDVCNNSAHLTLKEV